MKFSDWLRGVASVVIADVNKVFDTARAAVAAVPFLPTNIKTDATNILNDAQSDLQGLEGLAGSVVGAAIADGVDDVTTLFLNTANAVSGSASISQLSVAEKAVLGQAWTAMKAQGDTLYSQIIAGLDPTKASSPPQPASGAQS